MLRTCTYLAWTDVKYILDKIYLGITNPVHFLASSIGPTATVHISMRPTKEDRAFGSWLPLCYLDIQSLERYPRFRSAVGGSIVTALRVSYIPERLLCNRWIKH